MCATKPTYEGPSRRSVLGFAGTGAGAAALAGVAGSTRPAYADDAPTSAELAGREGSEDFWRRVRELFVLDENSTFMNVGTVGSPPREVLDAYDATNRRVARDAIKAYEAFDDVRARAAAAYGCDPDELAITHNTTDGIDKAFAGLRLRPGDELLTTNHEETSGVTGVALQRDRYDLKVNQVQLPVGDEQRAEDYVELFRKAITPKTRIAFFSAATWTTGTRLPVRMLTRLAQDHGITTIVDAAHVPGMLVDEFRAYGADFVVTTGAKWQCGPAGVGVMYARNKVLPEHNPNPLPEFWPVVTSGYPDEEGLPPRTEGREAAYDLGFHLTKAGNTNRAGVVAFDTALAVWERIGRRRIEKYVLGLSERLKKRVRERWGAEALYSPFGDRRLRTAITSFNPFQDPADVTNEAKAEELVDRVRDTHGYTIRYVRTPMGGSKMHHLARISTHLFHNADDVDGVIDAVWKVSKTLS